MNDTNIRQALGLREVINVAGTMTYLGSSIVVPEAVAAMTAILPQFVEMGDLQRRASTTIAEACGSEAGFVTASCSSAITLSVAAAMTGPDLAAIERLPDTSGLKNEVVIQTGHLVSYGAPISQAIALAGANVVPVGQSTTAWRYQLEGAITEKTACAVYVVSHHAVQYGMIPLDEFAEVCRARGVPVIVDASSEYDLTGFLAQGADVVLYSAQKFLSGPTAGIVAGPKAFVRSAYLQNIGIGRGFKVGKEGIIGTIVALQAWGRRDQKAIREREGSYLALWQAALAGRPGVRCSVEPDVTHNPLDRLKVRIDPQLARITAWDFADALARGARPVIVRDHEVEHGYFYLDPCNLHPGEEQIVAARLVEELERAAAAPAVIATPIRKRRDRRTEALLRWPD
jgi:D-glucosaminate-6-phosphate ammonia-lyase